MTYQHNISIKWGATTSVFQLTSPSDGMKLSFTFPSLPETKKKHIELSNIRLLKIYHGML